MLSPERQLLLDQLYWNTNRTVKSIAEEFEITSSQVGGLVTPLPVGIDCWWCDAPLTYSSRSRRVLPGRWPPLTCPCGARQPSPQPADGLVDSDATILVPMPVTRLASAEARARSMLQDVSPVVISGVQALTRCGLRWRGRFCVVDITASPDALVRSLDHVEERTVVVPSLGLLATNEGDALASFFRLVQDGWRVITSAPLRGDRLHDWDGHEWYDELVPAWQRPRVEPERWRRPWG